MGRAASPGSTRTVSPVWLGRANEGAFVPDVNILAGNVVCSMQIKFAGDAKYRHALGSTSKYNVNVSSRLLVQTTLPVFSSKER